MGEPAFLVARGAFVDQLATLAASDKAAIALAERSRFGIATIMVRAGRGAALAERIRALFGLAMPEGPARTAAGAVSMIGTGPGTWLLTQDGAAPDWASGVARDLEGLASVADQSSGYAVLQVSGSAARDLMSRGAFLDFHDDVFQPGSAAVTLIAHIGVILWQVDNAPSYEIALFRSYAASFWHWIESAAEGMGVALARAA